jgi:uncharacterized protein related to proFAR isomerase
LAKSEKQQTNKNSNKIHIAKPIKHFEIIPSISIRRGRIIQPKGDKFKPLKFRGVEPHPLDLMDVLYETFETLLILDYDGIKKNKPAIDLYRKISQLGDFWVDGGARYADGVIDLLIGGAQFAVLGTKTLYNLEELKEAYELSENIIFGLDFKKGILSPDENLKNRAPYDVLKEVQNIGLEKCYFADFGRAEDNLNIDQTNIKTMLRTGMNMYIGGGIKCRDLGTLTGLKVAGAIVELEEVINNPAVFAIDPGLLDEIAPQEEGE